MGNFLSYDEEPLNPDINSNLRKIAGGNTKLSHFSEMTPSELTELSSPTSDIGASQQMEMNMLDKSSDFINTQTLNRILNDDSIQRGGGDNDSDYESSNNLLTTSNTPLDSSQSDINDLMQMGGYNSDSSNSSKDGSSISISSN